MSEFGRQSMIFGRNMRLRRWILLVPKRKRYLLFLVLVLDDANFEDADIFLYCIKLLKFQAEKLIKEMERKCEEKISENKEEAQRYLMHVKEEHGAMVIIWNSCGFLEWINNSRMLIDTMENYPSFSQKKFLFQI